MKKLILSLTAIILSFSSYSQDKELPDALVLETKEDYAKYEENVINSINWLINTPIETEKDKRTEVNAFLMKWLTGSPNVTIELNQEVVTFMECGDCLMVFLGGWAKYVLENNENKNNLKGNIAGIESLIAFYNNNKAEMGPNKAIEKYVKLKDKGKLESYIKSRI